MYRGNPELPRICSRIPKPAFLTVLVCTPNIMSQIYILYIFFDACGKGSFSSLILRLNFCVQPVALLKNGVCMFSLEKRGPVDIQWSVLVGANCIISY